MRIGIKLERMYRKRYILSVCFVDIYATWKVAVTLGPLTEGAGIFEERSEEKMTGGVSTTEKALQKNSLRHGISRDTSLKEGGLVHH